VVDETTYKLSPSDNEGDESGERCGHLFDQNVNFDIFIEMIKANGNGMFMCLSVFVYLLAF